MTDSLIQKLEALKRNDVYGSHDVGVEEAIKIVERHWQSYVPCEISVVDEDKMLILCQTLADLVEGGRSYLGSMAALIRPYLPTTKPVFGSDALQEAVAMADQARKHLLERPCNKTQCNIMLLRLVQKFSKPHAAESPTRQPDELFHTIEIILFQHFSSVSAGTDFKDDPKKQKYTDAATKVMRYVKKATKREYCWEPIETAPKDEIDCGYDGLIAKRFLAWDKQWDAAENAVVAYWDIDHWQVYGRDDATTHFTPTHWRPLPKPPTDVEVLTDKTGQGGE